MDVVVVGDQLTAHVGGERRSHHTRFAVMEGGHGVKQMGHVLNAGIHACHGGVVIGGGNFWRGVKDGADKMQRSHADAMGMLGTVMNVFTTTLVAYPLSRKEFQGKGFYMFIFMFTMWFGGGLIPTYVLMSDLGLVNNRLSVLLSGLVSISNMVVMRSFFRSSIPGDLHDAARVDGISDIGYLVKIVLPLSKAIFSVVTLYYAVAHWNAYFSAMIYLRDPSMMTLQQVLKDLLAQANPSMDDVAGLSAEDIANMQYAADLMKYSLIVKRAKKMSKRHLPPLKKQTTPFFTQKEILPPWQNPIPSPLRLTANSMSVLI